MYVKRFTIQSIQLNLQLLLPLITTPSVYKTLSQERENKWCSLKHSHIQNGLCKAAPWDGERRGRRTTNTTSPPPPLFGHSELQRWKWTCRRWSSRTYPSGAEKATQTQNITGQSSEDCGWFVPKEVNPGMKLAKSRLTCFSLTRSGPNTTYWITLAINIKEQQNVLTKT